MNHEVDEMLVPARPARRYVLTRFVFLRFLGFIYFFAFLATAKQAVPLLGAHGVLPMGDFLARVAMTFGGSSAAFWKLPSLFWLSHGDATILAFAWIGVALSILVMLGLTNAVAMFVLWALYLSFAHTGQIFYGYGWEIQLCETGFVAMFLCPLRSVRPFPKTRPPVIVIWLLRWLIVRIMLGAGLIKLRGDPCWRDLTCLVFHYETQPLPNPLSWLFNRAPLAFHEAGALVNHGVEVVAPFFAFGPRKARLVAGCAFVVFQIILIASGNLSFLNYLTIAPAIACFDDDFFLRLTPKRWRARAEIASNAAVDDKLHRYVATGYAVVVGFLSLGPIDNLLSTHQAMNRSFEPFALVNTYGAFGSVGKKRYQVVIEGTDDDPDSPSARWQEYELPCAPGDPMRRPCVTSPYQPRLDWQIWFLPFSTWEDNGWLVRLTGKLLDGDDKVLSLFSKNPFPDAPPKAIRASLYHYRFTRFGEPGWWVRERTGEYMPPLRRGDPILSAVTGDD